MLDFLRHLRYPLREAMGDFHWIVESEICLGNHLHSLLWTQPHLRAQSSRQLIYLHFHHFPH